MQDQVINKNLLDDLLRCISSFILDPNDHTYEVLVNKLKTMPRTIIQHEEVTKTLDSFDFLLDPKEKNHVEGLLLIAEYEKSEVNHYNDALVKFLLNLLENNLVNSLIWNSVGMGVEVFLDFLTKNNVLDLPPAIKQKIPEIYTPKQFVIFCYSNALLMSQNNIVAWNNLGVLFQKGLTYAKLPDEVKSLFAEKKGYNARQLAFSCYHKVLLVDKNNITAWNRLGSIFKKDLSYFELSDEDKSFFAGKERYTSKQLAVFCFSKALSIDQNNVSAWNGLEYLFCNGLTYVELPAEVKILFAGKDRYNSKQLAVFCDIKVLSVDQNDITAWNNLGIFFQEGLIYDDLPDEGKNLFAGKELSSKRLAAFCFIKALLINRRNSIAWHNLGIIFQEGLIYADLSDESKSLFAEVSQYTSKQLAAFCYIRVLLINQNDIRTWNNLGFIFQEGLIYDDLPDESKSLFAEKDHYTSKQLAAFCFSKVLSINQNDITVCCNMLGIIFQEGLTYAELSNQGKILFAGKDQYTPRQLAAFCFIKVLAGDRNNDVAWKNLGIIFQEGLTYDELPNESKFFFRGEDQYTSEQLAEFCHEKISHIDNSSMSIQTDESHLGKRKADNPPGDSQSPNKKQKTEHDNRSNTENSSMGYKGSPHQPHLFQESQTLSPPPSPATQPPNVSESTVPTIQMEEAESKSPSLG